MKKVIVNEQVLRHMLMEMAKETVNEAISTKDAYDRFYATRLNRDTYDLAMGGTVNMTPFHKLMLEIIISNFDDNQGQANAVAAYGSNVWKNADANMRQLILKKVKSGEIDSSSPAAFMESLKSITNAGVVTKKQASANGLVTLYEDDYILITCTLSYAASTKYYGMTSWCTASDLGGRYNGFYMFKQYTSAFDGDAESCLIQIVNKRDKSQMVQMLVDYYGEIDEDNVMNKEDECVTLYMVDRMVANAGSSIKLGDFMDQQNWESLVQKTGQCVEDEREYWEAKTVEIIKQIQASIDAKVSRDDILANFTEDILNEWDEYGISNDDDLYEVVPHYVDNSEFSVYEVHGGGDYCVVVMEPEGNEATWLNSIPDSVGINTNGRRCMICRREGNTLRLVKRMPPVYSGAGGRGNLAELITPFNSDESDYTYYRFNFITGKSLPYTKGTKGLTCGCEFLVNQNAEGVLDVIDTLSCKKIGEIKAVAGYVWDDEQEIDTTDGRRMTVGQFINMKKSGRH